MVLAKQPILKKLNPFFTERTLLEDTPFYNQILSRKISIKLFDSTNCKELDNAIRYSDLLVMGGGPLMHIMPMYMIEYAFKKANKLGVKTAILGCGIRPMFYNKYKKSLLNIINDNSSHGILINHAKTRIWYPAKAKSGQDKYLWLLSR